MIWIYQRACKEARFSWFRVCVCVWCVCLHSHCIQEDACEVPKISQSRKGSTLCEWEAEGILDKKRVGVWPVVGAVLVIISKLEPKNIVHELYSNIVAEEHDVVTRSSIRAEIRLCGLLSSPIMSSRTSKISTARNLKIQEACDVHKCILCL